MKHYDFIVDLMSSSLFLACLFCELELGIQTKNRFLSFFFLFTVSDLL